MPPIVSTATFLDAVLPKGNRYIGFTDGTKNQSGREIIKCSAFEDGSQGVTIARRRIERGDTNIYFALASFKQAKIYDAVKGYEKSYRHQDNVDKLKSLWLDVDVKEYTSREECARAIDQFIKDLPQPTFVVDSGGGFHIYWCFQEELTPTQWQPLAQGLAAIAKVKGLKADFGVTIDSARVLRLPGSFNQKYEDRPECTVKYMGSFAHLSRMDELLRPHAAGFSRNELAIDPKVVSLFDPATVNDLAAGYQNGQKSFFNRIIAACPVVQDSMDRGGKGDGYALWKDLLHLAAFTEDGPEFAHEISKADPRYDPANTDDFYNQSVDIRHSGARGPTTCARFSMHSNKCSTCQHLNKIKTPWVLGVPFEEKSKRDPSHVRGGATYTMKMVEDAEGNKELEEVFLVDFELDNWRMMPTLDEESPYEIWTDLKNGNHKSVLKMSPSSLSDIRTFRLLISKAGGPVGAKEVNAVHMVATNWATQLLKLREGSTYTNSGWNESGEVFVLGETAYTKDGAHYIRNPKLSQRIAGNLQPKGKRQPWLDMAKRMLHDPEPAFGYALCAGMAGPLMEALTIKCSMALSLYSADSGAGKSTVLKLVRAAFGAPNSGVSLDDTANFIIEKMGSERGLPAIYDEIRGLSKADDLARILFSLSEGKTKGRLDSNSNMRDQMVLHTMLLCGSNISMGEYIGQSVSHTNAGHARFIEIELQPKSGVDSELDSMASALDNNYGHIGPEFIRYVMTNMRHVEDVERNLRKRLEGHRGWLPEERFWLHGTTKILTAGYVLTRIAPELELDMAKLFKYCFSVVDMQRSEMDDNNQYRDMMLQELSQFYAETTLVTDAFKMRSGPVTATDKPQIMRAPEHRNEVNMHASVADKALRIRASSLDRFADHFGMPRKALRESLRIRFGMKPAERRVWCAGVLKYSTVGQTMVYELDMKKIPGGENLISFWSQGSDS